MLVAVVGTASLSSGAAQAGPATPERAQKPRAGRASPAPPRQPRSADANERARRSAVYGEIGGKTGFWGVGYDYRLIPRLAVGVTASIVWPRDQTVVAAMAYAHAELVMDGHHSWFAEIGPMFAVVHADSPVPEWSGVEESSVGVELASGYEYRNRFLFRGFVSVTIGSGDVAPWGGAAFGWTF